MPWRMASNQVEKIVKLYRAIAQIPSLGDAKIQASSNGVSILTAWSQRNLERKNNQKFMQCHCMSSDLTPTSKSFPIDITTELLSASTVDDQRRAVLRQATVDNSAKQFIEIWDKEHMVKNYDLSALDVHGDVYFDSEFASFEWSPDKTKVLYIAEKKLPKSEPFYKQKPAEKDKDKNEKDNEVSVGNEYVYKPHWGEQLVGKHRPIVAVLDTTTDTISAQSGIPDELSPAQVLWTKDSQGIVGLAWKHEPRYLGLIACTNRLSWIFFLKDGKYQKLSADGCAVRTPRFNPEKKSLIWLEREAGGAHHNAHRLMYLDFESAEQKAEVLVKVVETSEAIKNSKHFYGLYGRLPRRCWSSDSRYIFLSSPQQNNVRSYIVDTITKDILEIQNDKSSLIILDVHKDVIAFAETSLMSPTALAVGRFEEAVLKDGNVKRVKVTSPVEIPGFDELMYEANEYQYDTGDEVRHFNYIYFGPKAGKDKSLPLIVAIHGGPHSNYANSFSLDYSLLTLLGLPVIQVNYRGSTGMGSKNVEYLQGKVGDVDVRDCATATKEALTKYPWLDPDRVALTGGSHGGFLVTHLSGQYPDMYKAVVARNPVIDIAAMFTISDIPDWCAAEVNMPFDESVPIDQSGQVEMLLKMFKASPIVHVDKVKAPTLLCIGTNDLRVPPSQGKLWYHRLKANNVKTKMLVYEDNHPLASATAEIDNLINLCLWLLEHTSANEHTDPTTQGQ